ncbi:hypothetical protein BH10CHL1_BH10CHL1_46980 [soil metagenome]
MDEAVSPIEEVIFIASMQRKSTTFCGCIVQGFHLQSPYVQYTGQVLEKRDAHLLTPHRIDTNFLIHVLHRIGKSTRVIESDRPLRHLSMAPQPAYV